MKNKIDNETVAQIREIAREEAQEVYDLRVRDADGTEWSLSTITERFGCSRRTALKALGLIAVGYTGPVALLKVAAGTAEAAPDDDLTVPGTVNAGAVRAKRMGAGTYHFVGDYDGSDPDARLTNALSAASAGDKLFLESGNYATDRTISDSVTIEGTVAQTAGSEISGAWTLDATAVTLRDVFLDADLTVASGGAIATIDTVSLFGQTITVQANQVRLINLRSGSVTFESGTGDGIIDASTSVSVTDNGANTVGTIG
jgi:hypothetical protein